jgi:enamine deaminase RidA (YjgF/YER057c/UK114 family)
MKISVVIVEPRLKGDFVQELGDCIVQLKEENLCNRVISSTVFLNAVDNEVYNKYKELASEALSNQLKDLISVNYVGQPPVNGDHLAFEIHMINEKDWTLDYLDYQGYSYVRAISGSSLKGIFVSGLQCGYAGGVSAACDTVFATMDEILTREGLSFNHVVRQWNYIENILQEVQSDDVRKQHYQMFNDVRTTYYNKASFMNGYPAATGIGMVAGGVTLSFYALPETPDINVIQVDNPFQQPAFDYPDEVLVGESSVDHQAKTTPKFVRAKHIDSNGSHITLISGTASIRNEKTVAAKDMQRQLLVTLENIEHLISRRNMENSGIRNAQQEKVTYYRGYVKNISCIGDIIRKCEELLPGVPYLFLVSDICRQDLLIEIEAFSS